MNNKPNHGYVELETAATPSTVIVTGQGAIPTQQSFGIPPGNSGQPQIISLGEPPVPPSCGSIIANAIAFILCPITNCLSLPGLILGVLSYLENRANNLSRSTDYRGHSFRLAIAAWVIAVIFWIIFIIVMVMIAKQATEIASHIRMPDNR